MCGIAFLYDTENPDLDSEILNAMVSSIEYRGPDDRNICVKKHAALGHVRLSIVDIRGGSQPMESMDLRYTIIYNGEIYNYAELRRQLVKQGIEFSTKSDTEVLLQLYIKYGASCLAKIRGMFSFVIHDQQTGELFAARDRLGIKPFFYCWNGKQLIGASEVKAVLVSGMVEPAFNPYTIVNFFKYQFSVPPYTIFNNVTSLEPGHYMTIAPGSTPVIKQYWDLEFPEQDEYEDRSEDEWCSLFESALDDAAVSHMIGEVPIGAYLSGGIDSAATTYLLDKHYENHTNTFTIRFTNVANDESAISRNIAEYLGVPNTELIMDDDREQGYSTLLEQAIYHLEQPQRVAVDIPHFMLSDLVNRNNYKVVYTGDGADEILGGYDCYRQDYIRQWGNMTADMEQREHYYLSEFSRDFAEQFLRMLLQYHEPEMQEQIIDQYGCYPVWHDQWHVLDDVAEELLSDDIKRMAKDNNQMQDFIDKIKPALVNRHPLNQSLYIETKTRLANWILWKSDRLSMAHSVEVRVPFMDHILVEFAAQIPPELKLNGMNEKYILKKIITPNLPQHPQSFKKRAFYTPIREWFFTKEKINQLDEYLSVQALKRTNYFNIKNVQTYIKNICEFKSPSTPDDYYSLMKLEWGLMIVLTVQILDRLFIQKKGACFTR